MRPTSLCLRLMMAAVSALALTGCAFDPEASLAGVFHDIYADGAAEVAVIGDTPGSATHVSETVTWGEPAVVPAGFAGGPHAVADTDGPYLLDTGDRLRVFVYGQPNLSRAYTVDHDGRITVPLIGHVDARGRTASGVENSIRHRLAAEYVRDPEVTVDILQNRPFFILGEVKAAGQYPYVSGMTIETAIAIAGGYSERASDRSFRISRRINGFVEQIDVPSDYVVQPGDTVYVHERFF